MVSLEGSLNKGSAGTFILLEFPTAPMKATEHPGMVLSFDLYPLCLIFTQFFKAGILAKCQMVTNQSCEITSTSCALHVENRTYYLLTQ